MLCNLLSRYQHETLSDDELLDRSNSGDRRGSGPANHLKTVVEMDVVAYRRVWSTGTISFRHWSNPDLDQVQLQGVVFESQDATDADGRE